MRDRAILMSWVLSLGGCTGLNPAYGNSGGNADESTTAAEGSAAESSPATSTAVSASSAGPGPDPLPTTTGGESSSTGGPAGSSGDEGGTAQDTDEDAGTGTDTDPGYVVYLNFEGVTLNPGGEDATTNTSSSIPGDFAPYQTPANIPAILEGLDDNWEGLTLEFVTERPASGSYAMVVVTPTNPVGKGVLGVADLDCGDANPSSVAAAFSDNPVLTVPQLSAVISRELGFTFGLEPINHADDFMTALGGVGTQWVNTCSPIADATPACAHPICPPGSGNSYGELELILGAR